MNKAREWKLLQLGSDIKIDNDAEKEAEKDKFSDELVDGNEDDNK